jgi:hypothetical protein
MSWVVRPTVATRIFSCGFWRPGFDCMLDMSRMLLGGGVIVDEEPVALRINIIHRFVLAHERKKHTLAEPIVAQKWPLR